jgi:hypothetical protein
MFEPLLFFLALKAGVEARPPFDSSRDWLGRRKFQIHLAGGEGIVSFSYGPRDISSEEALDYLTELVRDFLDPGSLDLLPFDLLARPEKRLQLAYTLGDDDEFLEQLRPDYARLFAEILAEDQEQGWYAAWKPMKLMEIVPAGVPSEAFEKVRRRFRLLDRPLARVRAMNGGNRGGHD